MKRMRFLASLSLAGTAVYIPCTEPEKNRTWFGKLLLTSSA